jgi:hypothetical protein
MSLEMLLERSRADDPNKFGDGVPRVLAPVLAMTHGFSMTSHFRIS